MADIKRLFYDLETSPNIAFAWRCGGKQFVSHESVIQERAVICICWKWEGQKTVHSMTWKKGDDREMLQRFMAIALQADELVAHNGDRFDIKWFNTRCLYHRIDPAPIWKTVDTLAIARSRFYFNSNKLDYLANFLFGEGKSDTEFGMWKDIVMHNCRHAMKRMVDYCKRDVELLERVFKEISPYHNPKSHVGVLNGGEKWHCPRCGSSSVITNKTRVTTYGTRKFEMKCKECNSYFTISNRDHEQYLEARA